MQTTTRLAERQEVEDRVVSLFVATDEQDWSTVKACFADSVAIDLTSVVGGEPLTLTPQQIVEMWSAGFEPGDRLHHQLGNVRTEIQGAVAKVRCYAIALHHRPTVSSRANVRRFVGTYEIGLQYGVTGWQVNDYRFLLKFVDGDAAVSS